MYPNLAGRYGPVAGNNFYILGIKFTWDCSKEPYNRVFKESIMINN